MLTKYQYDTYEYIYSAFFCNEILTLFGHLKVAVMKKNKIKIVKDFKCL